MTSALLHCLPIRSLWPFWNIFAVVFPEHAGAYGCTLQLLENPDLADSYVAYAMRLVYTMRANGVVP